MDETEPNLVQEAADLLASFSIPLCSMRGTQPVLRGTGFLVALGTSYFLVSAAHVLDVLGAEPLFYHVTSDQVRKVVGPRLLTPAPLGRDRDLLDVGVVKLSGSPRSPYIPNDKYSVDLSYLRPRMKPRTGRTYAIVGYPETRNRIHLPTRQLRIAAHVHISNSIDAEMYDRHGLSDSSHIAVTLPSKFGVDLHGRSTSIPKVHGMSGSPIWALNDDLGEDTNRVFPLVGVATSYRKKDSLTFGTDIAVAAQFIQRLRNTG